MLYQNCVSELQTTEQYHDGFMTKLSFFLIQQNIQNFQFTQIEFALF